MSVWGVLATMQSAPHLYSDGGDAYRAWYDGGCKGDMPECPHTNPLLKHEWETGFDDAMEWQLHGQYE